MIYIFFVIDWFAKDLRGFENCYLLLTFTVAISQANCILFLHRFVNEDMYNHNTMTVTICSYDWESGYLSRSQFTLSLSLFHTLSRPASLRSGSSAVFSLLRPLIPLIIMTNTTKKQNHALQNQPPSPPSSTENAMVKELLEKNAELEHRLRKYKGILYLLCWALLTLSCRNTKDFQKFYQTAYTPRQRGRES